MRVTWNDIDSIYRNFNMLQQSILDQNKLIYDLQYKVYDLNNRLKILEESNVD